MVKPCISRIAAWTLAPASLLCAQIVALEPEQAGADFPFQGEYQGEITGADGARQAFVAQVSAFGNGSFRGVFFPGGFPGSPGHQAAGRVQIMGTKSGDKVAFSGSGLTLAISGAALTGTGPGQGTVSLAKVTRTSPTLGAKPPAGATVLFDGNGLATWKTGAAVDTRGLLGVPAETVKRYGNYSLHLEFRLPFEPAGRGQARGNSGIIMNTGGFSEIQVLDSFGDVPYIDGCGALFSTAIPAVEANLPPLAWQTYDINFTAPATTGNAIVTVRHNGVIVQNKTVLKNRQASTLIQLQDHQHPVFYRNIWILERDDYLTPATALAPAAQALKARQDRIVLRRSLPTPAAAWNGILRDMSGRQAQAPRIPAPTANIIPLP